MGLWFEVTRVAAAVNVVVLVGLGVVWGRNYWRFRSKHTLGLLVFAVLMLLENGMALYFFSMDPVVSPWFQSEMVGAPQVAVMALRVVTTAALVFLAWVSMD